MYVIIKNPHCTGGHLANCVLCTLVYRIDVHARLLILRRNSPLHGLILVCTFIDFEKKFPPARLFHPARLLVMVLPCQIWKRELGSDLVVMPL